MALDPYAPCPCGNGKKLKFCECAKDMLADLERVLTLLEADQRVAGLDLINKLRATKGDRAALLALASGTHLQNGEFEAAQPLIVLFAEKYPHNPLALAQAAILDVATENLALAVDKMQHALEHVEQEIPHLVYEALGLLGQTLLEQGNILGARGHLLLHASIGGAEDPAAMQRLMRLQTSPQIPLLLKQDFLIGELPKNTPWAQDYVAAVALGSKGAWAAAAARLDKLAERFPKEIQPLRTAAIFRSYVGNLPACVAAWRRYAAHPGVALEDAVEAEALAQMIDNEAVEQEIDVVSTEHAVEDAQLVMERLLSDKRVAPTNADPAEYVEE